MNAMFIFEVLISGGTRARKACFSEPFPRCLPTLGCETECFSVRGHIASGLSFHLAQELGYPSAVNRVTLSPVR